VAGLGVSSVSMNMDALRKRTDTVPTPGYLDKDARGGKGTREKGPGRRPRSEAGKQFFLERKNQRTLPMETVPSVGHKGLRGKVFLLLFLQKKKAFLTP